MITDPDTILLEAEDAMDRALSYLSQELRGVRTGRASPALVEFLKVEYYGAPTDLKSLAAVSVPEPSQLLIKPFDVSAIGEIKKAIETSGLELTPMVEDKRIRLNIPPLSGERRQQLAARVRKMGEEAKVVMRNARRDANKHLDQVEKDKTSGLSEDDLKRYKDDVQEATKKHETTIDELVEHKMKEITEV